MGDRRIYEHVEVDETANLEITTTVERLSTGWPGVILSTTYRGLVDPTEGEVHSTVINDVRPLLTALIRWGTTPYGELIDRTIEHSGG